MKASASILAFMCFVLTFSFGREKKGEEEPVNITQPNPQAQVFPAEYLQELGNHDATLRAIDSRLGGIDTKLTYIQKKMGDDIMPTIYVMKFLQWLFALIAATLIGVVVNNLLKNRPPRAPQVPAT